jgi:hypothetical protein
MTSGNSELEFSPRTDLRQDVNGHALAEARALVSLRPATAVRISE